MRRTPLILLCLTAFAVAPAIRAYAQSREEQQEAQQKAQAEEEAKKKEKEKQWNITKAPLPEMKNAGPCPFVKVLYDAARYIELKDGKESSDAVGYTGEIEGVKSACEYKGNQPIRVQLATQFAFGRGPQAQGSTKVYGYWVAVTVRNAAVLNKQNFDVRAVFPKGQDRVGYVDRINDIVIPRADASISGSNFEILVGFDVTPQMAEFNRLGKRFRVNAGATQTASAGSPGGR